MGLSRWLPAALALILCAAPLRADKLNPNEKGWSYPPHAPTSVLPEVEPNDACPGQPMACGDLIQPAALDPAGDADWFSVAVDETFRCLTIGTDSYQGSATDTYLELYDSCTGAPVAYDDDGGPGFFSLISAWVAPHAGTYYIKVRGYSPATTGAYQLFVWCTDLPLPPPDDFCSNAYRIERCTAGTQEGSTAGYQNDYNPGSSGCTGWTAGGRDAVRWLDLQEADLCHFVYTQLQADASFYLVTDCADVNGSCVAGADQTVGGQAETIDWSCPASGTYFLILDSYETDSGGQWTLAYEVTCPTPVGVCCVGVTCSLVQEGECAALQGEWHPEWESCGPPNPCDVYTPAEGTTWGGVKARFR
jgi:hypothetical protein